MGGTGLWDWPVARYMAWTHRMRSCSSSLANITVSPSFTALKKARPPSRPEVAGQRSGVAALEGYLVQGYNNFGFFILALVSFDFYFPYLSSFSLNF